MFLNLLTHGQINFLQAFFNSLMNSKTGPS